MKIIHAIFLFFFIVLAKPVSGWEITQLTANTWSDTDPQISGSSVVWQGESGIYLYDGTGTKKIGLGSDADISGSLVTWTALDENLNCQVFLFDGTATRQITNDLNSKMELGISGANIVWESYDFETSSSQIWLYDLNASSLTPVPSEDANCGSPRISGSHVVWEGIDDAGEGWISFYDIETREIRHIASFAGGYDLDVWGSYVVWSDVFGQITFFDGTSTQIVGKGYDLAISESYIVWQGYDGHDQEIYFYDIAAGLTGQLTDNDFTDANPKISGSTVVWWEAIENSGPSEEIFMVTIPEPMTVWLLLMGTVYFTRNRRA